MRARFVNESFLNEEIMTSYDGKFSEVTIFKNPKSIQRMSPWARAFHDQKGNFYIADEELHHETDEIGTMHTTILRKLREIDSTIETEWIGDGNLGYINGVCWQRLGKTNKFYLAESYDTLNEGIMKEVNKVLEHPNFYEPYDAKFILEVIDNEPPTSFVPPLNM